ncbi:1-aminocyclopropane-1-carboxylate deaminase/D-cysteine desulfhydrase [Psychroflexus sp. YR1-1]|uniref:1-aminocyclopropane-1-carboxylate deaminase/D-cysteine desulfhydrase n=1 Tax=Psychroflexus aurantiacus TaxID=2709310 RepID=A0A6B3R1A1_9FLAO|nr:pyridoxal-phosphate dependent enzyme [Psychroflexus aurantiacus]NEV93200.1 1-aminocyclopropane-1-carboxylate deaminase/D-cysteine desulfhydrase [Psychroflexus aurantiacus]
MRPLSFFEQKYNSATEFIGKFEDVELFIRREDQIHPVISGNKFRKLKYNLKEAQNNKSTHILTFGGAFSNHIAATAEACHLLGIQATGIIRGDELGRNLENTLANNATLKFAHHKGMQLQFVSRTDFRLKEEMPIVKALIDQDPSIFIIPEGGTNTLAIKGCYEILQNDDTFDFICTSVGTGGTLAGLIEASKAHQHCIGFSALKGNFLSKEIGKWTSKSNWSLETGYHFGGYAKVNSELIAFINKFQKTYGIPLDPVYTGKLFYGIFEMIEAGYFPKNTRILAVHTGGLQGIDGMNQALKQKGLQTIHRL